MHRPPAPRGRRPRNHNLAPRHRKRRLRLLLHNQTPNPHKHQQQAPPLPLPRQSDPARRRRNPANLRDRAGDARGHALARFGLRAAREVAGDVPREGFAGHSRDPGSVAVLWIRVHEGYGVAVSGAGARGGGVCCESGGGGAEVFGWVEGGGEEGGVDVACCAGGSVCLEGK